MTCVSSHAPQIQEVMLHAMSTSKYFDFVHEAYYTEKHLEGGQKSETFCKGLGFPLLGLKNRTRGISVVLHFFVRHFFQRCKRAVHGSSR